MKLAVVGATGAVGQTTLKILDERKFPVRELRAFASERSVGKSVTFKGEKIRVEKIGRKELQERIEDAWLIQAPKRLAAEYRASS